MANKKKRPNRPKNRTKPNTRPAPPKQNNPAEVATSENFDPELIRSVDDLIAAYRALQERFIDTQTESNKILKSYAALISNSFKLRVTASEFDVNDPKTVERLRSKLQFFIEDLPRSAEKAGILMPALEGLDYTAGLSVEAVNLDEFEPGEALVVEETLEPLLILKQRSTDGESEESRVLLKPGLVSVKRRGI